MGFNFNFFGETQHRVFNYKPIYFDQEKEERRQFFGDHGQEEKAGNPEEESYTPGKYLQGSFRDGNYQRLRTSSSTKAQKIIGLVGLVLFFIVLYYVAQFYGLILK